MADINQYLGLIIAQYCDQPKFVATVTELAQWSVDLQNIMATMPARYDVDVAVGVQLDAVGLWVGASRNVLVPIEGAYFELDSATLGLDQGSMAPDEVPQGIVSLPDEQYRTLIRARIAANNWDGSIPDAYQVWDAAFAGTGFGILIQDLENMHMIYALTGPVPDPVTLALFNTGALALRPAGVKIDMFITPVEPDVPLFGLDVDSEFLAGLDEGYFGNEYEGT